MEPLQLWESFLLNLLLVERKAQVHDELAALARLAFDGDGATHQVHDALGDGHAKSRARDAADGGAFLAGELLKDVRLELLAHADAVVLDAELVACVARGGAVLLGYADADHAARGGELDGVGQNVQQNLVEAQRIGDDVLVFDVHGVDEERQPLRRHIGLNDGAHVMDDVGQMHRLFINLDLAVLDAAHVQHVVDEGKEMLAGGGDLFQVVQHLLAVVNVGRGQRREADDGVHRRADIVAHVEEELPLGAVCRPLMLQGNLQPAILFLQLGLVLRLLLLVLPLHCLRRTYAQYLKDRNEQGVADQGNQGHRECIGENRFFIRVRIEIEGPAVAVHSKIAARAIPARRMRQRPCGADPTNLLHQRAVRNIASDQVRLVGGNDPIVLHHEQRAASLFGVAVQDALNRQRSFCYEFCGGVPIGKQGNVFAGRPAHGHIHGRPILQQKLFDIGLLRVAEGIQNGIPFELVFQLGVPDSICCVFAQKRAA